MHARRRRLFFFWFDLILLTPSLMDIWIVSIFDYCEHCSTMNTYIQGFVYINLDIHKYIHTHSYTHVLHTHH